MMKKPIASVLAGTALVFGATAVSADDGFSALNGIQAEPMTALDMATVEGKGHPNFALGALLVDVANANLRATPAWNDQGLRGGGPALSNAQVPTE